ncbi:hypothetical protein RND71_035240 [Anisodus tanguticus]|uniref:Uncharacterized protein n=1 Tax=Anisodus tanguticus TaxID=243964 RepID=A0AAE1R5F7_9SOLA|nr:hypothetical protein RND71_035240 [Anisodus tanguticus]
MKKHRVSPYEEQRQMIIKIIMIMIILRMDDVKRPKRIGSLPLLYSNSHLFLIYLLLDLLAIYILTYERKLEIKEVDHNWDGHKRNINTRQIIMIWSNESNDQELNQIIQVPSEGESVVITSKLVDHHEVRKITCPSCGHSVELQDQAKTYLIQCACV